MVIGIIGKTQGVKIVASPKPNATARKAANPSSFVDGAPGAAGGLASTYSAGITGEDEGTAGSTLRAALFSHLLGTHCLSLQVWYLPLTASSVALAGASFFN